MVAINVLGHNVLLAFPETARGKEELAERDPRSFVQAAYGCARWLEATGKTQDAASFRATALTVYDSKIAVN